MINLRFCKRCNKPYDIGTNFEICPMCRRKKAKKKEVEIDERIK